jgi:hypothetical protein
MDFMVCFTGHINGQDHVHTEWLNAHDEQEAHVGDIRNKLLRRQHDEK